MKSNRLLFSFVLGLLLVLPRVGVSQAQIASALIRVGDTLPGDASGFLISDIYLYTAQNGVGGFAFSVQTRDATGKSISNLWGNTTGGAGTLLRTQSTIGVFEQIAFYDIGMSDAGMLSYRAESTNTVSGAYSLFGTWIDSTVILNEGDPISTLPGNFSTQNIGTGITRDGTPYWRAGYSSTQGQNVLSAASAIMLGTGKTVLLKSGDNISGIPEAVAAGGGAISRRLRFSANGSNYIVRVHFDTGTTDNDEVMVSNGAALLAGGSVIREQSSVPTSIGGLTGELYDTFSRYSVTESGSNLIAVRSNVEDTSTYFLMIDGEIVLREGDVVDGLNLNGSIESAILNEDGDWAAIWGVDNGTDDLEALIMNGEILLLEGELVDWNNDGLIDGSDQNGFISDFTSGTSLTLSDRDANGDVRLLFSADVDLNGTVREAGFSMSLSAVPDPVGVWGDANGDENLDFGDIEAFFLALTDLTAYAVQYPSVAISLLDMNEDGNTDFGDIEAFFIALTGG